LVCNTHNLEALAGDRVHEVAAFDLNWLNRERNVGAKREEEQGEGLLVAMSENNNRGRAGGFADRVKHRVCYR
jgi:hypothetical protein